MSNDLTRPIIGIENRTAEEVFDIMADRIRYARPSPAAGVEEPRWVALLSAVDRWVEDPSIDAEQDILDAHEALRAAQVRGSGS